MGKGLHYDEFDNPKSILTDAQKASMLVTLIIDIRGFTGLETPNEFHNRGVLTDAHAHAALMVVKRDQYSINVLPLQPTE